MKLPRPIARPVTRAIARAKPRIPDSAWPMLLSARSALGDRPLIAAPTASRVLVLCPHPDDESVGCGGTMAVLAAAGADIHVLYATDGEATRGGAEAAGEIARKRRAEATAACRLLGTEALSFLSLPDGRLHDHLPELETQLAAVLDRVAPQVVMLPWFGDQHRDHRSLDEAFAHVVGGRAVEVWGYETWTPLPPRRIVDITAVVATKEAAIATHTTAAQAFDLTAILGLSRYRSLQGLMGQGWAEAFLTGSSGEYLAMRAAAQQSR
ncbi:MAG: group 1 glycosyl transferase [Acidimicrobiia bacterium]|nr:group 1 glycosyl transferase [Acidimicrobiia bacterium]